MDSADIRIRSTEDLHNELREIENTDFDAILNKDLPSVEELKAEIERDNNILLKIPKRVPGKWKYIYDTLMKKDFHKREGLIHYHGKGYSVAVSKDQCKRGFLIITTILEALKARGFSTETERTDYDISKNGVESVLRIFEKRKKLPFQEKWGSATYEPTGKFIIEYGRSYSRNDIHEGKEPFENQVSGIIAKLELWVETERRSNT